MWKRALVAVAMALALFGVNPEQAEAQARDSDKDFDFNTFNAAGNNEPFGIWSDGTTMWVADNGDDKLYAYNLSTKARDSAKDFDTLSDADNAEPRGIWSDGTTMWVADWDDNKIYAYNLGTKARDSAKDFNTLSDADNAEPQGIWSDGTTMWVADWDDNKIYAYNLSTKARDSAKDFNTLSDAGNTKPRGMWSDGATMWVADSGEDKLFAYNLSTKARDSAKDFDTRTNIGNSVPIGIWSDGATMWVADWEDDKLYAYSMPTPRPFVSNLGQPLSPGRGQASRWRPLAQSFSTGSSATAFTLSSIAADIHAVPIPSALTASVHTADSEGDPGPAIFTLTNPTLTTATTGTQTFTAPAGSVLNRSRTYYVVFSCTGAGECADFTNTESDDEDTGAAAGWTIGNESRRRASREGDWIPIGGSLKIRVSASPGTAPANVAATGEPAISGTVQANETLTASAGTIADPNGLVGAAYSYQWIIVESDGTENDIVIIDGHGRDTGIGRQRTYVPRDIDVGKKLKVRLTFRDDAGYTESRTSAATSAVLAPAAPPGTLSNLSAVAARDGADLSWSTTLFATGYEVQWKAAGEEYDAAARQATTTALSYSIPNLIQGTAYTVRVRATNGSGEGPWSKDIPSVTPFWTAVMVVGLAEPTGKMFTGFGEQHGSLFPNTIPYHGSSYEVTRVRYRGDNKAGQFKLSTQGAETQRFGLCLDGSVQHTALFLEGTESGFSGGFSVGESVAWTVGGKADVALVPTRLPGSSVIVLDRECPTAGVSTALSAPSEITDSGEFSVGVTFSEAVSGLAAGDFVVSGATLGALSGSGTSWSLEVTATGRDDVTVALPLGAARTAGGAYTASAVGTVVNNLNSPPEFAEGTVTSYGVAENTGTVFVTLSASDPDSDDSVTGYSLGGADAGAFKITSGGALRFDPAPNYEDSADKASTSPVSPAKDNVYIVTVTVASGAGGRALEASRALTVTVTDVDEPPPVPGAPIVAAKAGSVDTLSVSWSAPDTGGRPPVSGYGVQYKLSSAAESAYAAHTHAGTGTSTEIGSLTAGASYDVQVRAVNAEGSSGWSDAGTGTVAAAGLGKVSGVSVSGGVQSLGVSWSAVSGADGYRVQWKSGSESFDASREVSVSGVSAVVGGLVQGTEYTVRVAATKQGASDGAWSDEASGVPVWSAVLTVGANAPGNTFGFSVAGSYGSLVPSVVEWGGVSHTVDELRYRVGASMGEGFFSLVSAGSVSDSLTLCLGGVAFGTKDYLMGPDSSILRGVERRERGEQSLTELLGWSVGDRVDVALVAEGDPCPAAGVSTVLSAPEGIDSHDPFTVGVAFGGAVSGLSADDFVVSSKATASLSGSGASYSLVVSPANNNDITVTLPLGAAVDAAGGYSASGVLVVPYGDEGVTASPTQVSVSEAAGTATYTVVLDVEPNLRANESVVVTPVSSDTAAAAVSTGRADGTLVFTRADWDTPQTVTVTGVAGSVDSPGGSRTATVTHTAVGRSYNGVVDAAAVTVTVTDAVAPSVVSVSETAVSVSEAGGTATFDVSLTGDPGQEVLVTVNSPSPAVAVVDVDADTAGVQIQLGFDSSSWDTARTVTVTGVNDDKKNPGGSRTVWIQVSAVSGNDAFNQPASRDRVEVTVADDGDTAVTLVSNTGQTRTHVQQINHDAFAQGFTTGANPGGYSLAGVELALDAWDFHTTAGPLVTVHAADGSQNPADPVLWTLANPALDSSSRGALAFAAPGGALLAADTTYFVKIFCKSPGATVCLLPTLTTSAAEDAGGAAGWSIDDTHRQQTGAGWSSPAAARAFRIGVNGAANNLAAGRPTISGDAQAGATLTADVSAVTDADGLTGAVYAYQWIRVDSADSSQTEVGDGSGSYTVAAADVGHTLKVTVSFTDDLGNPEQATSQPTATITAAADTTAPTVKITVDDATLTGSETAEVTVTFSEPVSGFKPAELTTSAGTLAAVSGDDGDTDYVFTLAKPDTGAGTINLNVKAAAATDAADNANTAADQVTVAYDNAPVVAVTKTAVTVAETAGAATFEVSLTNQPAQDVTVTVASSDATAAVADTDNADGIQTQITFTATDWNTKRTVTVTGVNDNAVNPGGQRTAQIQISAASTDAAYDQPTARDRVEVTVTDDETVVLVSNTAQTTVGNVNALHPHAQAFTTGANATGYTLAAVTVSFNDVIVPGGVRVALHAADSSGGPAAKLADLAAVSPLTAASAGPLVFAAPADTTLAASTDYLVVVSCSGQCALLDRTNNTGQDSGAAAGWSIADTYRRRSGSTWPTQTGALQVRVLGAANPADPNSAPAFAQNTATTHTVTENTATTFATLTATDTDNQDTITGYTLSGADADAFKITSQGALRFDPAPNYEDPTDKASQSPAPASPAKDNVYIVTVTATSGAGDRALTGSITLTVTVTDTDEAPAAPTPTVTALAASSLTVGWAAPANSGPAVTDYDVRWCSTAGGNACDDNNNDDTDWTVLDDTGPNAADTTLSATIGSLTAGTAYEVQARAQNDEGASGWSASVSAPAAVRVALHAAAGSGLNVAPGAQIAELAAPALSTASSGPLTFAAPDGTTLAAGTRYFVVISCAAAGCANLTVTFSTAEDAGAAAGWTIDDEAYTKDPEWESADIMLKIRVHGTATTAPDTTPPTVEIAVDDATLTGSETAEVTVTFSEPVSGFASTELTASAGTLTAVSGGDGDTDYVFTLAKPDTGSGTISLNVKAAVATDSADNANTAADQVTVAYDNASVVAVSATAVTVAEAAGTATFTVSLTAQPAQDVTVTVTSSDASAATVDVDTADGIQTQIIFTASDWSTAPAVVVVGVDDAAVNPGGQRTVQIRISAVSADAAFNQPTARDRVEVAVTDDETAVLVSNTGQSRAGAVNASSGAAQAFTTGPNATGYTLAGAAVLLDSVHRPADVRVALHAADASGTPAAKLADLTAVSPLDSSSVVTVAFAAPATTALAASTEYFVVISCAGRSQCVVAASTSSAGQDAGAAAGWAIADSHYRGPSSNWQTQPQALMVRVLGAPNPADPNSPPAFTAGTATTHTVAENTDTAFATLTATDPDAQDSITGYTLGGADADAFKITSQGALRFDTAPNHEDPTDKASTSPAPASPAKDNIYIVTVTATAGADGRAMEASITLTVTVTDTNEAPAAPAPSVTATTASTVTVGWAAPANAGPAITDYDVRWCSTANSNTCDDNNVDDTDWTELDDTGDNAADTTLSATIGSLAPDTDYRVQVRAQNGEGTSGWSTSVSATTAANSPPAFAQNTATTHTVAEVTADAFVTLTATDPDAQDSVTGYALSGADADAFKITSQGALRFDPAPNHEDPADKASQSPAPVSPAKDNVYIVTVTAASGSGDRELTASITLTVTVTDAAEPPSAPSPSVTSVTDSSVTVGWAEPANTGPAITDYDVRWCSTADGNACDDNNNDDADWTVLDDTGANATDTTLSATIGGLVPVISYEVQVRAQNAEGVSGWSSSVTATTSAANDPPEFEVVATTHSVAENTAMAFATIEAIDTDPLDSVTGYSLSGADADAFKITSGGELRFDPAPNHEDPTDKASTNPSNAAKNNAYIVTVTAASGSGDRALAGSVTLTVTVTDVDEPPPAPAAPAVGPKAGTAGALSVSWSAPDTTGRPAVSGYRVSYKLTSADVSAYASHPHSGTATSTDIASLTAGASYDVRIQAFSDEGDSPWSQAGTGSAAVAGAGPVLVSNVGQAAGSIRDGSTRRAQRFTTGSDAAGYDLAGIALDFASVSAPDAVTVALWASAVGLDRPGTQIAALTNPALSTSSSGLLTFAAPDGTTLAAGTRYFVVASCSTPGSCFVLNRTGSDAEDAGAAAGWSIANRYHYISGGGWVNFAGQKLKIRVHGTAKTADFNSVPAFAAGTVSTHSVAENTATAFAILTASDADAQDSVTGYSLSGADAGAFKITTGGALRFDPAPDHEDPTDKVSQSPAPGIRGEEQRVHRHRDRRVGQRRQGADRIDHADSDGDRRRRAARRALAVGDHRDRDRRDGGLGRAREHRPGDHRLRRALVQHRQQQHLRRQQQRRHRLDGARRHRRQRDRHHALRDDQQPHGRHLL